MDPNQINNGNNIYSAEESVPPTINQTINDNKPPAKNSKWKKTAIVIALVIVAIPLLGFLLLVISFSGGTDGVLNDLKPAFDPKSSSVSAKRDTTMNDIVGAFNQLDGATNLKEYVSSTYDHCYTGQNNWKVKEGYAHRCDYRVTRYYGFNGDFRQEMLDLEQDLFGQQWQTSKGNNNQLSYYIREYYDQYYGDKDPSVRANYGGSYLVSSMPTVINGYSKNDTSMDIAYGERESKDISWLESAQDGIGRGFPIHEDKKFVDSKSTFEQITKDNKYILAISLEKNYFEN